MYVVKFVVGKESVVVFRDSEIISCIEYVKVNNRKAKCFNAVLIISEDLEKEV